MDNDTYDQMPLNKADLGDCLKYLKENKKEFMIILLLLKNNTD